MDTQHTGSVGIGGPLVVDCNKQKNMMRFNPFPLRFLTVQGSDSVV